MGSCCCKCTPRWMNDDEIICAYVYEECACCRPRRFVLSSGPTSSEEFQNYSSSNAKSIIESEVFDPYGTPIHIAQNVPKACCGYAMYETAVKHIQSDWCPRINGLIESYGFVVDGFEWVEYRYVSHGSNGGGHTQPVPHFCIRVKLLTQLQEVTQVMGEVIMEDAETMKVK